MPLPHRFEVITKEKLSKIHEATLGILRETGVKFHNEDVIKLFKKHGAKVDGNVVHFSRELVEKNLETVPSKFRWKARNDNRSVILGEGCKVQPIAGPTHIQDMDHGRRLGTLRDLANIQKIYQSQEVFL